MIADKGRVYVCGWGGDGQLGLGFVSRQLVLRQIPAFKDDTIVVQIAAGYWHSLCVTGMCELTSNVAYTKKST